ncbi:MAG: tetratricopeptide repeat protein [Bacteroidota bacterium]
MLCFVSNLYAQEESTIDSLLQVISSGIADEEKVDTYIAISKEYTRSDSSNSAKYANMAISLAEESSYSEGLIAAKISLAEVFSQNGHFLDAKALLTQTIDQAEKLEYGPGKKSAQYALGVLYFYRSSYDSAKIYFSDILENNDQAEDESLISKAYNGLGNCYSRQGNNPEALNYFLKSLEIEERLGDKKAVARKYINIGLAYQSLGNGKTALEYYFKGLKVLENSDDKRALTVCLSNIGTYYQDQGDSDKALQYYKRALEIDEAIDNKRGIYIRLYNIGSIYEGRDEYDKALDYYLRVIVISEEIENQAGVANGLNGSGRIYSKRGDQEAALENVKRALAISRELGTEGVEASSLNLIGEIYFKQSKFLLAKKNFDDALLITQRLGLTEQIQNSAANLAQAEEQLGNYRQAYQAHILFKEMSDSLRNEEQTASVTRMEAEFEFQQKRDSINLVQEQETIRYESELRANRNTSFFVLSGVVLIALVVFVVVRNRSNKRQRAELELKVQEATQAVEKQNESLVAQQSLLQDAILETKEVVRRTVDTGKFDTRISLDGKDGEWLDLAETINDLFETVVEPLKVVGEVTGGMSEGRLNERFEKEVKGDILILKNHINNSMDKMSSFIGQIQHTIDVVTGASRSIQTSSKELGLSTTEINHNLSQMSQGMNDQVVQIGTISSFIDRLQEVSKKIDTQANLIFEKTTQDSEVTDLGLSIAGELEEKASKVLEKANQSKLTIGELKEKSTAISNITALIKEIADQTNLLSLNASIQASHAGEHGKGFIVIAEEIRRLADVTKDSLKEIDELIQGVQSSIELSVDAVSEIASYMDSTKDQSSLSLDSFKKISESSKGTLSKAAEISASANEQSSNLQEISASIKNVVVISEEAAAGSHEISSSCEELSKGMNDYQTKSEEVQDLLDELQESVKKFTV